LFPFPIGMQFNTKTVDFIQSIYPHPPSHQNAYVLQYSNESNDPDPSNRGAFIEESMETNGNVILSGSIQCTLYSLQGTGKA
jgi:hypothetical protein